MYTRTGGVWSTVTVCIIYTYSVRTSCVTSNFTVSNQTRRATVRLLHIIRAVDQCRAFRIILQDGTRGRLIIIIIVLRDRRRFWRIRRDKFVSLKGKKWLCLTRAKSTNWRRVTLNASDAKGVFERSVGEAALKKKGLAEIQFIGATGMMFGSLTSVKLQIFFYYYY